LPSWRYEFAAGVLDEKIYVVGGISLPSVWFPMRLVEVYDVKTDVWKTVAPYPKLVHHTGAVACMGKLYVVGGNGIRIYPRSSMFVYDPSEDSWMKKADLPTARGALGVVSLDNHIYAVGGGINTRAVNILEAYDPVADEWITRGRIFVMGGYTGNRFNNLTANEAYDPKTDMWEILAPLPYPVSGLAIAAIGGSIFIFGGEQGWAVSPEVHEYKIKENRWARRTDLPVARYALTATTVGDKIHVIGGSGYLMGNDFRKDHDIFVP
jgi:N-acetylneuraminic acid mutarotase